MPLYEYKCEGCGDVFEVIQRFSDEPVKVHEKCGAPVHRLISAPALQFKGTGWYVTDYAKSGSNAPAQPNGSSKNEGESKGSGESKNGGESKSSGDSGSNSGSSGSSSKESSAKSDSSKSSSSSSSSSSDK